MATTKLFTALDLQRLPDDGQRYDLIRGELYRMPPAEDDHGGVAGEIASHVGSFNLRRRLGKLYIAEAGFYLERDPDAVVAPAWRTSVPTACARRTSGGASCRSPRISPSR